MSHDWRIHEVIRTGGFAWVMWYCTRHQEIEWRVVRVDWERQPPTP